MGRLGRRSAKWVAAGWMLLGALSVAAPAWACSVPVFRYALERWPAAPYVVWVFHRGPLPAEAQKVVAQLTAATAAGASIDLRVTDLDGKADKAAADAWVRQKGAALPWMVVQYPEEYEAPEDVWSGPLSAEAASALVDSPARRQVARRILEGDCAVFLLLESGRKDADDAAAALLESELKRMAATLEIPALPPGAWDDPVYDREGPPKLKVAFSLLRLRRADPAEAMFVRMLLGIWPDADAPAEPKVFPMFGRGRAGPPLVGPTITKDHVEYVCEFLIGPCSCMVKEANPGVDMLTAVNWDAALAGEPSAIPKVEVPPLAGLAGFRDPPAPADGSGSLLRHILLAAVGGVVVVAVVALALWRRSAARGSP